MVLDLEDANGRRVGYCRASGEVGGKDLKLPVGSKGSGSRSRPRVGETRTFRQLCKGLRQKTREEACGSGL